MKARKMVLIGAVPVLLIAAVIVLAVGTAAGGSDSTRPPPESTPSPPLNIPEPRSTQDGLSSEERNEIKARRGAPQWGPHTAGTVIEIAGQQVQLPENVHVKTVIAHILCAQGGSCVDTLAWMLQRGDSLFSIGRQSGRPAPGRDIPEAFDFLREALR